MSAVVELLLQAASGATVQFPPELARQLLDCSTDAAVGACLGLSLPQRVRMRNALLVETARILSTDGCTTWQGYYFSRPLPVAEFAEWVAQFSSAHRPTGAPTQHR